MLIDWFTVVAQTVNFLILVWLLRRFLYGPILAAIDKREQRVAGQLRDATASKAQAERERTAFEGKNKAIDEQRGALVKKAEEDADAERRRLLDDARTAADALRARLEDSVRSERINLNRDMIRRTQDEVLATARKVLTDLAGMSLEERMVEVFVRRLRELSADDRRNMVSTTDDSPQPIVRSAFQMSTALHADVEQAVGEMLGSAASVQFEVVPDLVSGVELAVAGHKVAWSVADYLSSLDNNLRATVNTKTAPEARRGARA